MIRSRAKRPQTALARSIWGLRNRALFLAMLSVAGEFLTNRSCGLREQFDQFRHCPAHHFDRSPVESVENEPMAPQAPVPPIPLPPAGSATRRGRQCHRHHVERRSPRSRQLIRLQSDHLGHSAFWSDAMPNVQHMINIQQTLCPWATRINAGPRSDFAR
jgi:hypothetical protein